MSRNRRQSVCVLALVVVAGGLQAGCSSSASPTVRATDRTARELGLVTGAYPNDRLVVAGDAVAQAVYRQGQSEETLASRSTPAPVLVIVPSE